MRGCLHRMVFYLSGPMEGVSTDEMSGWRNRMAAELRSRGHSYWDPARKHEMDSGMMSAMSSQQIVSQDKEDIMKSDYLLAKITTLGREYWGTSMEIMFMAEVIKRPVLVICPSEYSTVRAHPWLVEHVSAWYESEDDFISALDLNDLPRDATGDIRLAPVGFTDVNEDTVNDIDLNDWVSRNLPVFGQGGGLRVLLCKKIVKSTILVGE
jgi:hypothetical protein